MTNRNNKINLEYVYYFLNDIVGSVFYIPIEDCLGIGNRRLFYPIHSGKESQYYNLILHILPEYFIESMIKKYELIVRDDSIQAKQRNFVLAIPTNLTAVHNEIWKAVCADSERNERYLSFICKVTSEEPNMEIHIQEKSTFDYVGLIYPSMDKLSRHTSVVFGGDKELDTKITRNKKLMRLFDSLDKGYIRSYIDTYLDDVISNIFSKELEVLVKLREDNYLRTLDQLKEFNVDKLEYVKNHFDEGQFVEERLKLLINLMYIYYHNNLNPFVDIFKQD